MRDYGDIMDLAIARGQYSGYLDTVDKQKAAELERAYVARLRAFAAAQFARQERLACGMPVPTEDLDANARALLGHVTTYLRDDRTRWADPVQMTIVDALRRAYPCPAARP